MSRLAHTGGESSTPTGPAPLQPLAGRDTGAPALADDAEERTLVTFRLGWQTYALPLECVERVLRMVAITAVPEAPADVLGIIDLQGEVIPVIDLRQRLGLARQRLHVDNRLLVVRVAQQGMAFAIDEACAVLTVAANLVESPPGAVARARPLAAVIRRAEGILLVLDEARLLPADDAWQGSSELDQSSSRELLTAGDVSQLTRIRGIGRVYAERLAKAGLRALDDLAAADAEEIVLLLGLPSARRAEAESWIEQANELARPADDTPSGDVSTEPTKERGLIR